MNELERVAGFFFEENYSQEIRITEQNNERWFVAADICKILEIKNPTRALSDFPENERMTLTVMKGHAGKRGGARSLNVINEAGLYRLIFKSRKPEAERFKTWVFNEVLPSIRKKGLYKASLPKTWSYAGDEELTWKEWVDKREKAYFRRHPDASFDDFVRTLPNR